MKKDKTTTFGREYFLESLPVEWDERLDGPRESQRKEKGDVKVNHADLAHLRALGLVRANHTPVG
jgi:hypothetical protein